MSKMLIGTLLTTAGILMNPADCRSQSVPHSSVVETTPRDAPSPQVGSDQFRERYPRYRLGLGDTLDIVFQYSPEFNQTLTIQPDGYVILREAGALHIAGQTVSEATDRIRGAYGRILNDPSIAIVLKDFQKPYFVVDGQVGKPGKYDLRGDTTVTEAVAVAGGFLPSAKHSQVLLFRRVSDQWLQARILNVKAMVKHRDLREDLFVQPGDMLIVPKNFISKIDAYLPRTVLGLYSNPF